MKSGDHVEIYDKPKAYTQRPLRTHSTCFVRYSSKSQTLVSRVAAEAEVVLALVARERLCVRP